MSATRAIFMGKSVIILWLPSNKGLTFIPPAPVFSNLKYALYRKCFLTTLVDHRNLRSGAWNKPLSDAHNYWSLFVNQ